MKYKIYPDIAVFGKSIANGIPLIQYLGKKKLWIKQKIVLYSTFGQKLYTSSRFGNIK